MKRGLQTPEAELNVGPLLTEAADG
jgi:hypothetical protein